MVVSCVTRSARRVSASLTGSYLLQMTACTVLASALPYLVTRNLGRAESDIGLTLGALMGASVLTPPLWGWVGSRYGERRILIAAMGAFALACLAAAAAVAFHLPWYLSLGIFACAGVAFCGLQVVPFTLLAHLAHAERQRFGASAEATITGLWTATEKLGLALGPAVTAATLAAVGFGDCRPHWLWFLRCCCSARRWSRSRDYTEGWDIVQISLI